MKKILFVIDTIDVGGATKLTFDLIALLGKKHYNIDIIYLNHNSYGDNNLINYFGLESKSKILWYKNFRSFKRLLFMYKNFRKYDLVHSCMEQSNFYTSLARALPFSNFKLIITYHGLDSVFIKGGTLAKKSGLNKLVYIGLMKYLQNILYARTDRFVAVCQDIKRYLQQYRGISPSKTSVIYHGLNFEYLKSTSIENNSEIVSDSNIFVIGYIGRLGFSKGLEGFFEVIPSLIKIHKKLKIIIKGNGELEDYLKNKVKEYDLLKFVSFENFDKKVTDFYRKIDLLVLPSLYETTNLTVLEAMYSNTLVLTSDAGGLTEIIEDGINGFTFKTSNFEDLVRKIFYIIDLKDKEKATILNSALQTVRNKFDLSKNILNLEQEFLSEMNS